MYHEIYGKYYEIIRNLLNGGPKTEKEIDDYIRKNGFDESVIYLNAEVLVNDYHLFDKRGNLYYPVIKNKIPNVLTSEQKKWISKILQDDKIELFLKTEEVEKYLSVFGKDQLYNSVDYEYLFQDIDKDIINHKYKVVFKSVLFAIKNKKDLKLIFKSSKNYTTYKTVSPYKIEYSMQDKKFRILAVEYRNNLPTRMIRIRLSSIKKFTVIPRLNDLDYEYYLEKELLPKPLIIEVYPVYNGIERIFIELSNYKRESVFDKEKNCSIMKIYYEQVDELKLVLKILSFGKAVKIISDGFIKDEVLRRLKLQADYVKEKGRFRTKF